MAPRGRLRVLTATAVALLAVAVLTRDDVAFAMALLVLGVGLLVVDALLPRLDGQQTFSATGVTLSVKAETTPPTVVPQSVDVPATSSMPLIQVGDGPAVPLQPGDTMLVRVTARTPRGEEAETTVRVSWRAP